jgi:hypothetical protein
MRLQERKQVRKDEKIERAAQDVARRAGAQCEWRYLFLEAQKRKVVDYFIDRLQPSARAA